MLTLLEALDELNSKSESELTLDYLEELAKKVSSPPNNPPPYPTNTK